MYSPRRNRIITPRAQNILQTFGGQQKTSRTLFIEAYKEKVQKEARADDMFDLIIAGTAHQIQEKVHPTKDITRPATPPR